MAATSSCRVPARRALTVVAMVAVFGVPTGAGTPSNATASPAPPAEAAGTIGVRLLEAPASAGDDPRARLYIVDHLAPGTVIERQIEVSNTTDSSAHVELYPAAAGVSAGSFLVEDARTPNEVSTWTSVLPGAADIPAGGQARATVRVAVPDDAAPGEHYGVVWAEARAAPGGSGGMTYVSRVGIRVYLSVGPGGPPAADFTVDSLIAQRGPQGQPIVLAMVHNTGGRALDMYGDLELSAGPGGLRAGPIPATLGTTVAIGGSEPVEIALDARLPAGPWDARITLHSGLIERTALATITFPDTGSALPAPTGPARPGWLYPVIAVAVLLLGVAVLLVVRGGRRGRGRRPVTLTTSKRRLGLPHGP